MSANSASNPSNSTTPVNAKEMETSKSSHSSKDSGDATDVAGKGENEERDNVNEVDIHGSYEASAKKTIKKEKHHEKLEDQREEQEKKESLPKTTKKKQPSPVDDILDTKQRLKKRARDGQERRPSLQQECSSVQERKHSLPGTTRNDLETIPAPLETKAKERQEGATPESNSATKLTVDGNSTNDADTAATTSSSHATNEQGNPFTNVTSTSLVVKAGEPAQISVNVRRSTDVHCTWKKDGRPIKVGFLHRL
ncbi:hypothetical protein ANCCAN_28780 [Ancylostoma caninum]|uniref:Immunoglobulin I-set domain protein n=1 Tax=Ancylostoma caninum TaxID=29170 RepID=A0A368F5N9_ANCCA|nr:hypothetical protein ANCCAN_28780 [Ancylostoma caninum]